MNMYTFWVKLMVLGAVRINFGFLIRILSMYYVASEYHYFKLFSNFSIIYNTNINVYITI